MYINNISQFNYYRSLLNNVNSTNNNYQIQNTTDPFDMLSKNTTRQTNFDYMSKLTSSATIKTDAEKLSASAKAITAYGDKGIFSQKTGVSEDNTKVTASAENGALNTSYSVTVSQIAKAQVNASKVIDRQQVSNVDTGTNTISIKNDNTEKSISFDVASGDTNETVLNKMAKAINKEDIGYSAQVVKNNTGGVSLEVSSKKTGSDNNFTLTDKVGNAAQSTGITNVKTAAEDSKYTINNETFTSSTNKVTTDKGRVTFDLNNVTDKPIKVTVKQDSAKIANGIETFVKDYNNLVQDADTTSTNSNSIKGIINSMKNKSNSLENIGITVNSDNTLTVDKSKLTQAIDTNMTKVRDAFTNYDGVAKKAENFSVAITKNPFQASEISTLDVYNMGMVMSYPYVNQGSILNLYR